MEIQKAGDNSQLLHVGELTIVQGIDEKRAREIYDEKFEIAKKNFTEEAFNIANERVKELESKLIPKMNAMDDGLKAFADPSFQLLLVEAQKTAAATERVEDYELLSELLIHRIKKGNDRNVRTGIHRAIEIVEDISNEALLGLTIVHAVNTFMPLNSNLISVLEVLNNLYERLIYAELPTGDEWIENLETLGAIRVNQFGKFKPIEEYYMQMLDGIAVIGIKKDSENYYTAKIILQKHFWPFMDLFTENELLPGYVRINVACLKDVDNLTFYVSDGKGTFGVPLSDQQRGAFREVMNLYSKDRILNNQIRDAFIDKWKSYPNLNALKVWFEKISLSFKPTSVGKILAHANAQRCDKTLPSL